MQKLLGACVVAVMFVGLAAPARADRVTRTEKVVRDGVAAECRRLSACAPLPSVDTYEASWTHRALGLQRALDDGAPFLRELLPHTHNSFNASAYQVTLTQQDPNQLYSMRDQLRMDIRALEMDVHKWRSLDNPTGPAANDVVLCHGQEVAIGPIIYHLGCSVDRPFVDGLSELRGWLSEPANRDEVVLLYLENNLDGDLAAHNRATADIASVLGPLVYRPPAGKPCAPMPMSMSRAGIRATGARILIVGNCGPGAWGTWVHERGPQWDESSSPQGNDYPDYPQCRRGRDPSHLMRRYEDSTWLTEMADGTQSQVTLTETGRMARCGVNLIGFDQLRPDDPRLAALVWSWAPGEPRAGAGSCAAQGPDARFRATGCGGSMPLACQSSANAWSVARACPRGTRFAVPANGYENQLLRDASARVHASSVRVAAPF